MSADKRKEAFVAQSTQESFINARLTPTFGVQGERLKIEAAQYRLEQMIDVYN